MAELCFFSFSFFFFGMVEMYDIPVIWVLKIVGREGRVSLVFFLLFFSFFLSFFLSFCVLHCRARLASWLRRGWDEGMGSCVAGWLAGLFGCGWYVVGHRTGTLS